MDEGGDSKDVSSEVILEEHKTKKENLTSKEEIEINSESSANEENGNKVITIVAQENNGQIIIYERNGGVVEIEGTSEFLQVDDSNSAFEADSNSREKRTEGNINAESNKKEEEKEEKDKESEEKENGKEEEKEAKEEVKEKEKEEEEQCLSLKKEAIEKNKSCNDQSEKDENIKEVVDIVNVDEIVSEKIAENAEENQSKNYRSAILEDWEVEVPHSAENLENFTKSSSAEEPQNTETVDTQEIVNCNSELCTVEEVTETYAIEIINESEQNDQSLVVENQKENSSTVLEGEILKLMADTKVDSLKYSKSISKSDVVKILDESAERMVKPIVTGKDLFFSIELTKRLNQKLLQNRSLKNADAEEKSNSNEIEMINNNNTVVDDRQKIVDILEADEIKDWKSLPSKSDSNVKENGNDMEISNAIKNMEEGNSPAKKTLSRSQKRTSLKKFRTMDKELERTIALQQLREEFPSTRKRTRKTKKVNHIPFLASTVVEKALTSPEVTTALKPEPPKRRPCYLPESKFESTSNERSRAEEESQNSVDKIKKMKLTGEPSLETTSGANSKTDDNSDVLDLELDGEESGTLPNAIVKTYSVKRKSTDAENSMKSTLETIAAVTKALSESATEETNDFKPKKQKTAAALTKSKNKINRKGARERGNPGKSGSGGRRNLELEKLLGDEGAVRMLYETQHKESNSQTPKKSKAKASAGQKNDLVLKTKLVKNAVMRLSGVGTEGVFLRGKRFSKIPKPESNSDPLFSPTSNVVLYKPKKQTAEASRILYRHSSSESFESSEGYRRTSFDEDGLNNSAGKEGSGVENDGGIEGESNSIIAEAEKVQSNKAEIFIRKRLNRLKGGRGSTPRKKVQSPKGESLSTDSLVSSGSKLDLSNVPVRKSSRPRTVSKKYSIWSSTSMDSLSAESLGLKKLKKASTELGKKLNCKELTILQYESLVQVILSPVSTLLKNSLNLGVLEELKQVFRFLSEESGCNTVLVSSLGTNFCQGIDINQIISCGEIERKEIASRLVKAIGELCGCLSDFKKPLIAGVQGAAIGLGVTLLPYCDLVVASDKASFYTPYVKLGQAAEGAATYTFPRISRHLVSELLFQSHKMTAADAFKHGLVSRIIPEERFEEELLLLSRNMSSQPNQGVQSIKFLLGNNNRKEVVEVLRAEGEILEKHWTSTECLNNMIKFLNSGELQLKQLFDHT